MADDQQIGPYATVLAGALEEARLAPVDEAAAGLAEVIAKEIDLGGDPVKLAPIMLRVLDALQMTPRARAVAQRGGGQGDPAAGKSVLDELRERRARKYSAEDRNAAAP